MATNERVNFELELCGAIERNKNLLPPDAFNCDQFNGLLRSIGGLSMPPLWHVSILKIAAVIADQQAKRAEEELLRQTQNEYRTYHRRTMWPDMAMVAPYGTE